MGKDEKKGGWGSSRKRRKLRPGDGEKSAKERKDGRRRGRIIREGGRRVFDGTGGDRRKEKRRIEKLGEVK